VSAAAESPARDGDPARTLAERRIVICVGTGGVGKTTVAAALGLEAARAGRRTLVLTIDPARRLADALGVADLGNEPRALPEAQLRAQGVPPGGSLSAVMLDMKRTFDELVDRFAENGETRERILANPIYQHVSDALAGSVEYSAMEKVYQLAQEPDYDLIIVDTPPAQHALDFLEAPQRLLEFLDSRLVHLLIHPAFAAGRFGVRVFQRGARRILKLLERITGVGFLQDVSEFLLAFEGMSEGFRERAETVRALALGPGSAFVLVAGPERESLAESAQFLDRLETFGVRLAGVVANRVRHWPDGPVPERVAAKGADRRRLVEALAAGGEEGFPADAAADAAIACAEGYAALVRRDEEALRGLRERTRAAGRFWRSIPEMETDVHDLDALSWIGQRVTAAGGQDA
jgi:anion-transporting  ArsA/GET3 family ATPase